MKKVLIKVVKRAKFLGPDFDTKLTFKNYVQHNSYQDVLCILRVVEHSDWGADSIVLLGPCHSLVASELITDALFMDRLDSRP